LRGADENFCHRSARGRARALPEVAVDTLYAAYKSWCETAEHPKDSKHVFGRNLRAAVPAVRRTRPSEGDGRRHVYSGIALRTPQDSGESEEEPLL
jgi:hypothetical protein